MELVKKQIVKQWSGKPVTDQFLIDEDYNVPDNKKDIKKVMISEGELRIEEIRKVDNYGFTFFTSRMRRKKRWPNCPVSFRLRRWFIPRRRGVTG